MRFRSRCNILNLSLTLLIILTVCNSRLAVANTGGAVSLSAEISDLRILLTGLSSPDLATRLAAAYALGEMSHTAESAVPALIEATQDQQMDVRVVATFALGKIGVPPDIIVAKLIERLTDEQDAEDVHYSAARALGRLGATATAAVPALLSIIEDQERDENVRFAAVVALTEIGPPPEAIPALIDALQDPNMYVRKAAATTLQKVAPAALPHLFDALARPNWTHRNAILAVLPSLGESAVISLSRKITNTNTTKQIRAMSAVGLLATGPTALSTFQKAAQSTNVNVKAVAVASLGYLGEKAIPILLDALSSSNSLVRKRALEAIVRNGPNAVQPLSTLLRRDGANTLPVITEGLQRLGVDAVPTLLLLAGYGDHEVRLQAIEMLGRIGPPADGASQLSHILAQIELPADLRSAAAVTLVQIGREPALVVPTLTATAQITPQATSVLTATVQALGQYGFASASALPTLLHLLESEESALRLATVDALGSIGIGSPAVIAALQDALDDDDVNVRIQAAVALGRLGNLAGPAVSDLIATLEDPQMRRVSAEALGYIGPAAQPAIPHLIALFADADAPTAQSAIQAIPRLGPVVVPSLLSALEAITPTVRGGAAQSLAQLKSDVVPDLIAALRQQNPDNRELIRHALARIGVGAMPGLIIALLREDVAVRRDLVEVLAEIGPSAFVGFQVALQDPDETVRDLARGKLANLFEVWERGAQIIRLGIAVKEAIPFLETILQAGNSTEARQQAIRALALIGPDAAVAAPALALALQDEEPAIRCEAALALLLIGPDLTPAAPALVTLRLSSQVNVLCQFDTEVVNIIKQSSRAEALAALTAVLEKNQSQVELSRLFVDVWGMLGPQANDLIPELIQALHQAKLRRPAAEALANIGADAVPALFWVLQNTGRKDPALADALAGKGNDIRRSAAYALLRTGAAATIAPQLTAIVEDDHEDLVVRTMVAVALEQSGRPVQDFWQNHNLINPLTLLCPTWVEMEFRSAGAYDLYDDSCAYTENLQAPTIRQIFAALVKLLGG